jgi:cysteine desulfurase/selenocysteine lyase
MINIDKIRAAFPILSRKVNGQDLVYFDNGATTQKPQAVIDAESNYYANENANVHRGVHFLSGLATDKFEETRNTIQAFIGAKHSPEIIFTKGTTDSINLVANGFRTLLNKGDEVIISELEHHSNIVPWQMCCQQSGATLKVIPLLDDGSLDMIEFDNLLSENTKLVAVSHISNALGTINDIETIIAKSHKIGAQVLIDGAQAASHIALDMQKLDADLYCFSAH